MVFGRVLVFSPDFLFIFAIINNHLVFPSHVDILYCAFLCNILIDAKNGGARTVKG